MFPFCVLFVGLFIASEFGFHCMANPRRNVFSEIAAWAVSLVVGLVLATLIMLNQSVVTSTKLFYFCMFLTCGATLCAALPRLLFQTLRNNQVSIGFFLRATAYVASVVVLGTNVWHEDVDLVAIAAGCFGVKPFGFYAWRAIWGWEVSGWIRWPLAVLAAYLSYIAFVLSLYTLSERNLDPAFWLPIPGVVLSDEDILGMAFGCALFYAGVTLEMAFLSGHASHVPEVAEDFHGFSDSQEKSPSSIDL